MARTIGIGIQDFGKIIENHCFYVDKTAFIKEWWENLDDVTLITRPRRFGKTLTMSMLEHFFSLQYADRGELFENLSIWQEEKYRSLQGTYPVIALSFASVKENNFVNARKSICQIISGLYDKYDFLLDSGCMNDKEKAYYRKVSAEMEKYIAVDSLRALSGYLSRYYGRKVIILLDEYDTPMQEAYVYGYWEEMVEFTRSLFSATFKTNPCLDRGIMTGITRVSRESVFSDLNHLEIVTTTSRKYETAFGFTQEEVLEALEEYGLSHEKETVKQWYDGFTFGEWHDIYNPWSIINYLEKRRFDTYWANTSSNQLVGKLIREGTSDIKMVMEDLLSGGVFSAQIDEQIVFDQMQRDKNAIWSLLLASGYLKVEACVLREKSGAWEYRLSLTNREVYITFEKMIKGWFSKSGPYYNDFVSALVRGDKKAMNTYMNKVALTTFSFFDTGNKPSEFTEPERFYHGFVLGLMVELADRYTITSNRESGLGRYDVLLEPFDRADDAIIIEFKVHDPGEEKTLKDTAEAALLQIERKEYAVGLRERGISENKIRKYGFAFEGKTVLIE